MAVQQIGLGCKSSKKSLSARAAHFSHANAVYFFSSSIFLAPLCLSLFCQQTAKTSSHHFTENTLTGEYFQRECLILALRAGKLSCRIFAWGKAKGLSYWQRTLSAIRIFFSLFHLGFYAEKRPPPPPSLLLTACNMNTHSYRTPGKININSKPFFNATLCLWCLINCSGSFCHSVSCTLWAVVREIFSLCVRLMTNSTPVLQHVCDWFFISVLSIFNKLINYSNPLTLFQRSLGSGVSS